MSMEESQHRSWRRTPEERAAYDAQTPAERRRGAIKAFKDLRDQLITDKDDKPDTPDLLRLLQGQIDRLEGVTWWTRLSGGCGSKSRYGGQRS